MDVYLRDTEPLLGHYESEGLLAKVAALGTIRTGALTDCGDPRQSRWPGRNRRRLVSARSIEIKSNEQIRLMRRAGLAVAGALNVMGGAVRPEASAPRSWTSWRAPYWPTTTPPAPS